MRYTGQELCVNSWKICTDKVDLVNAMKQTVSKAKSESLLLHVIIVYHDVATHCTTIL